MYQYKFNIIFIYNKYIKIHTYIIYNINILIDKIYDIFYINLYNI